MANFARIDPAPTARGTPSAGARKSSWPAFFIALILATACTWPQSLRTPAVFIRGQVFVLDPDDYTRFHRVRRMTEEGLWRLDRLGEIGPPPGVRMHWTLPNDYLLVTAYRLFGALAGGADPLAAVCAWVPVVLGWTILVTLFCLAARVWGSWPAAVCVLMAGLSSAHQQAFSLGHPDHHALLQLLLTISFFALLAAVRDQDQTSWRRGFLISSGLAMGLGVWVVVQALYFWAVGLAAFLAAATFERDALQRRRLIRQGTRWCLAVLAAALAGHVLENAPNLLSRTGDMISLTQLILMAVLSAGLLVPGWGERPSRARLWFSMLGVGAALAVYLWVDRDAVFHWARHPLAERWFGQVLEFSPLVTVLGGEWSVGPLHRTTGWAIYALPVALGLFAFNGSTPRFGRCLFVLLTVTLIPLGIYQIRWLLHAELVWAPVLAIGLIELASRLLRLAGRPPRAWAAAGVALLLGGALFWPSWRSYYGDYLGSKDMIRETERSQNMAYVGQRLRALNAKRPASLRSAILADWTSGPALMYFSGLPVVAAPYHRDLEGIEAAARFFVTAEPEQARALAGRVEARYVVVPELEFADFTQSDMEELLFGEQRSFDLRRRLAENGEIARRLHRRPDAPASMMWRLSRGEIRGLNWLRPVVTVSLPDPRSPGAGPRARHVAYELLQPP